MIDNYGRRKYRRWTTHLTIGYDTSPDVIEAFCEGVRELIRVHPYTRKDYYQVWLHHFGAHSLDVLVYLFFECPDWNTELRERHRMMLDIIRLADRLNVEFAYPTQSLKLSRESAADRPILEPPSGGADDQAQADGRAAVAAITADADWRRRKPGPYRFRYAEPTTPGGDDDETQIESKIGGDAG